MEYRNTNSYSRGVAGPHGSLTNVVALEIRYNCDDL